MVKTMSNQHFGMVHKWFTRGSHGFPLESQWHRPPARPAPGPRSPSAADPRSSAGASAHGWRGPRTPRPARFKMENEYKYVYVFISTSIYSYIYIHVCDMYVCMYICNHTWYYDVMYVNMMQINMYLYMCIHIYIYDHRGIFRPPWVWPPWGVYAGFGNLRVLKSWDICGLFTLNTPNQARIQSVFCRCTCVSGTSSACSCHGFFPP